MTTRKPLLNRRGAETFEVMVGRIVFAVTVGFYPDGRFAEVFITGAKAGSEFDAVARDGAILLSLSLQHGVPLEIIRGALTREGNGAASTIIGMVVERLVAHAPAQSRPVP